jgi:vacuole morphology and inheritance protein 14
MSVKNGAELLDRLIKDIISESATSYVSIVHDYDKQKEDDITVVEDGATDGPTAFSLPRFIPLLQERILVLNPFTRMFLVSWITLLDSIPDLELVTYLPSFLGGLFRFLNDSNQDVVIATQHVLERFLDEIKLVAKVKRGVADSKNNQKMQSRKKKSNSKSVKSVEEI